jgi:small-conductance mechanosensitive channel
MKRKTIFIYFVTALLLAFLLSSCVSETPTEAAATSTPTATQTAPAETGPAQEGDLAVTTPNPKPTVVAGPITDLVETVTEAAGVDETVILGLTIDDWINLGISVLIVLFGVLMAGRLFVRLVRSLVQHSPIEIDDALLQGLEPDVRWLVSAFFVQFATTRLVFISADVKGFLGGLYFVIYLVVIFSGLWKVVDHAIEMSVKGLAPEEDAHRLKYVLPMLHRVAHFVLIILGTNVLLARFGINLGSIATALGLGGLAISLAAQDVIGDLIAGFILLVSNKPFRVGDRIEIQGLDTWGDVVDISARTTSIRTRDNRMVIVPNSTIAKSQVVNYTYPDPRYRVQIEIGVAYGTDIEKTRRIIIETVSQIEDVLQDKPVDALYNAMGDSAMIFRVRWWIKSYTDTRAIFDRVNTALQNALDEAGIEMPFPTQDINVQIDSDQRSEKET